jgi:hypothetical protein
MRLVLWTILSAVIGAGLSGCGGAGDVWQPPRVVTIESQDGVFALLPAGFAWVSDAVDGQRQALLLRDGDIIGSDVPFRYLASDGPTLRITTNKWSARLGETTVSVSLDDEERRTWLSTASDRQRADLRAVGIEKELDADTLSALKRLAVNNPSVDLFLGMDTGLQQVLPLFRPQTVFVGEKVNAASLSALASHPQVETLLIVKATEHGSLDVLGKLPNLRRLIIIDWDAEKSGPLPAGLSGLKTLSVMSSDGLKDLSALKSLPAGLEELSLVGLKNLTDISGLERLTGLHTLVMDADEGVGDLSALASHQQLRWVGLPAKTSQEQFAAFVNAHPNLAILDMTGSENVKSLAPLSALNGLQGLILNGPYENLSAVRGLTSLRFLGISKKTWEASPEEIAAIRKALPDVVVVRVSPFCLGSGWILLLIPVLAVFCFLRRQPLQTRTLAG